MVMPYFMGYAWLGIISVNRIRVFGMAVVGGIVSWQDVGLAESRRATLVEPL